MSQKGKQPTVPSDIQAKEKLANYVYEYLIHSGATKAAQTFLQEIHWDKQWATGDAPGFLNQWWCVFYDLYNAAPERRETFEHSSEAKAFHDYGFVNAGFANGLTRNPSIASPVNGGMPPNGGRPPSSQGILPPDNGMHTPVSMPGAPIMIPGGPFFAPNHGMNNFNGSGIDMRNRAMMHSLRMPQGPQMGMGYHPSQMMPRQRYNPAGSVGIANSPGPSGTSQSGQQIMVSPGDSLQNELQQQQHQQQGTPGQESFGQSVPTRSPSHSGMNQPAPAFPPPPASETASEQSHSSLMNGIGSSLAQFSQHPQSHTMDYMSQAFDNQSQMKHSPQMHDSLDFGNPMLSNGPPFPSEHGPGGGLMRGGPIGIGQMPSLAHMHMMQQGLGNHHVSMQQAMANIGGGGPSIGGQFMSHQGVPISASPTLPFHLS